jgi:hypothetical protein
MLDRWEAESIERTRRLFARMTTRGREVWLIALDEAVQALTEDETST